MYTTSHGRHDEHLHVPFISLLWLALSHPLASLRSPTTRWSNCAGARRGCGGARLRNDSVCNCLLTQCVRAPTTRRDLRQASSADGAAPPRARRDHGGAWLRTRAEPAWAGPADAGAVRHRRPIRTERGPAAGARAPALEEREGSSEDTRPGVCPSIPARAALHSAARRPRPSSGLTVCVGRSCPIADSAPPCPSSLHGAPAPFPVHAS